MQHCNLLIQCPYKLIHHQSTKQIQPQMPHQFDTTFIFIMANYYLQQFQPDAKKLKTFYSILD